MQPTALVAACFLSLLPGVASPKYYDSYSHHQIAALRDLNKSTNYLFSLQFWTFPECQKNKQQKKFITRHNFSKHRPSGPMLFISQNVRLSVCPSVLLFVRLSVCSLLRYRLNVFLPSLPEVGCSIFFEILRFRILGKSNGKKWSQIWTFLFENCQQSPHKKSYYFCWCCLTKHGGNHASRWIWDLWSKGVLLILAHL